MTAFCLVLVEAAGVALDHPWPSQHLCILHIIARNADSHPHYPNKQKGHRVVTFCVWWRRRESNPRPQVLCQRLYMLIPPIVLTASNPTDRAH